MSSLGYWYQKAKLSNSNQLASFVSGQHGRELFWHGLFSLLQGYGRKKFVFQGVHETICYGPSEHPWKQGEVPINQIVFIGKGLDRKVCLESQPLYDALVSYICWIRCVLGST
jgi:hypothetical protein